MCVPCYGNIGKLESFCLNTNSSLCPRLAFITSLDFREKKEKNL